MEVADILGMLDSHDLAQFSGVDNILDLLKKAGIAQHMADRYFTAQCGSLLFDGDAFFGTGNEVRTDNICVYSDGVLIGGTEPDGSKPAAPEVPATTEAEDTTPSTKPDDELKASKYGDANCDGAVDVADVVLIKCYLINSNKYKISADGVKNADVQNSGSGLNTQDALAIQKYALKMIDELPV